MGNAKKINDLIAGAIERQSKISEQSAKDIAMAALLTMIDKIDDGGADIVDVDGIIVAEIKESGISVQLDANRVISGHINAPERVAKKKTPKPASGKPKRRASTANCGASGGNGNGCLTIMQKRRSISKLKRFIEDNGFSRRDIFTKLGVAENCLSNWLTGRNLPTSDNARKINALVASLS